MNAQAYIKSNIKLFGLYTKAYILFGSKAFKLMPVIWFKILGVSMVLGTEFYNYCYSRLLGLDAQAYIIFGSKAYKLMPVLWFKS